MTIIKVEDIDFASHQPTKRLRIHTRLIVILCALMISVALVNRDTSSSVVIPSKRTTPHHTGRPDVDSIGVVSGGDGGNMVLREWVSTRHLSQRPLPLHSRTEGGSTYPINTLLSSSGVSLIGLLNRTLTASFSLSVIGGAGKKSNNPNGYSTAALGVKWCSQGGLPDLWTVKYEEAISVNNDKYYRNLRQGYMHSAEADGGDDSSKPPPTAFDQVIKVNPNLTPNEPPTRRLVRWVETKDLTFVSWDEYRREALPYALIDDVLPVLKYESPWWKDLLYRNYGAFGPPPSHAPIRALYDEAGSSKLSPVSIPPSSPSVEGGGLYSKSPDLSLFTPSSPVGALSMKKAVDILEGKADDAILSNGKGDVFSVEAGIPVVVGPDVAVLDSLPQSSATGGQLQSPQPPSQSPPPPAAKSDDETPTSEEDLESKRARKKARIALRDSVSEVQTSLRRLFGRNFTASDSSAMRQRLQKGRVPSSPPRAPFLPGPPGDHFETLSHRRRLSTTSTSSVGAGGGRTSALSPFVFGVLTEGQFESRIDSTLGTWLQDAFHVYLFFDSDSVVSRQVATKYDPNPSPPLALHPREEFNKYATSGIPMDALCPGLHVSPPSSSGDTTSSPSDTASNSPTESALRRNISVQFIHGADKYKSGAPNAAWKVWEIVSAFSHTRTLSFLDAKAARYAAAFTTTTSSSSDMRMPLWFVLIDDDVYVNAYNWAYSLEPHTRILHNSYERWLQNSKHHASSSNFSSSSDFRCKDTFYGGHALTFAPTTTFLIRQARFVFGGTGAVMSRGMMLKAASQMGVCRNTWRKLAGDEQLGACISKYVPRGNGHTHSLSSDGRGGDVESRSPTILPLHLTLQGSSINPSSLTISHADPDSVLALLHPNSSAFEPISNRLIRELGRHTFNFGIPNSSSQFPQHSSHVVVSGDALIRASMGCSNPHSDTECKSEAKGDGSGVSMKLRSLGNGLGSPFESLRGALKEAWGDGMYPLYTTGIETPFHPINYFRGTGLDRVSGYAGSMYLTRDKIPYITVAHHHVKEPNEYWALHSVELAVRRREAILDLFLSTPQLLSNFKTPPPITDIGTDDASSNTILARVLEAVHNALRGSRSDFTPYEIIMAMELYLGMVRSTDLRQYMLHVDRRLVTMREVLFAILGDVWGLRRALLEGRRYLFFSFPAGDESKDVEELSSTSPRTSPHSNIPPTTSPATTHTIESYLAAWTVALVYPNDGLILDGDRDVSQLFPRVNQEEFRSLLKSVTQRESALIQSTCLKKREAPKKAIGGKHPQLQPKVEAVVPDIHDRDAVVEKEDMGLVTRGLHSSIQRRHDIPESLLHNFQSFNEPSALFPSWIVEEEIVKRQAEEKRLRRWDAGKLKKSRVIRRPKV